MTTPAKKPAAPRAAATKTTRTTAARPAVSPATRATAAKAPARAAVAAKPAQAPAPEYNFTKPYKFLTGLDDGEFCSKVSAHLNAGYVLVGGGTMTVVGGKPFVGQAVYKASNVEKSKAKAKAKSKGKKK